MSELEPTTAAPAAILDVDGTLMDTNYHHAVAWYRAVLDAGLTLPIWRIHRHIGMGGDQLVAAVAGNDVEEKHGDELRRGWEDHYRPLIEETRPLEGARRLLRRLRDGGRPVVLASSAPPDHLDVYLDAMEARDLVDGWTTADDVEATKPEPDLIRAALAIVGTEDAVLVGDSTWDCEAADKAGVASVAILTGGFSERELRDAGAAAVFDSLDRLIAEMDNTPLGRRVT